MTACKNKGKKSASYWREKAELRRLKSKRLAIRIKRLEASRDKWKNRYKEVISSHPLPGQRLEGHQYSLPIIWLAVVMHIQHNISLRAVRAMVQGLGMLYDRDYGRLSATTIRNWSIRLGLYYLSSRPSCDRYALIVDESVSIGQEKVLLILGVPLPSTMSRIAPLTLAEVEVIHVASRSSWKGSDISEAIEAWRTKYGVQIAYAVTDAASNIKNGLNLSAIHWIYDCSHVIANQVQRMFSKDDHFNNLVKRMNTTRTLWPSCQWAPYMPPTMRKKARFHQVLEIHCWANFILQHFEHLPDAVQKELAYLEHYKDLIMTLSILSRLAELFSCLFKAKGICGATIESWQEKSKTILDTCTIQDDRIEIFKEALDQYLQRTLSNAPQGIQLLCCSDVIESMFGKYKNKGGPPNITEDILKIAAFTKSITLQDIRRAMLDIPVKKTQLWKQDQTESSLLAQKRKIRNQFLAA